jgi:glycosyltransferase involved in cell wall biosynthesis
MFYQGHSVGLVEFTKWSLTRTSTPIDDIIKSMESNNPDPEFHLNFCLMDQSQLNPSTPNYIYTMFETDKICPEWVDAASRVDGVFVPTEWNKQVFIKSGIPEDKVFVCPPPLDIDFITKSDININIKQFDNADIRKYKHRFLNCSEYITRKNLDGLLSAWCDETKPEDDACLVLKLNSNSGLKTDFITTKIKSLIKRKACAPIFIFTDFLSEEAMLGLYKFCTHYITCSYGEGWGLSESICGILGKKVIAPAATAFVDYLNKENSYPTMGQWVAASQQGPTAHYYQGSRWFAPLYFSTRKNIRASINDANKGDTSKEQLLSKQLIAKCDSYKVAAHLINTVRNHCPKKAKVLPPVTSPKQMNFLMTCKSLNSKCGIADYTLELYKAFQNNADLFGGSLLIRGESVGYRAEIDKNDLHVVHLQLEYQFISPKRLDILLKYLKNSGIKPVVTLHTVNPRCYEYHEVLERNNCSVIVSSQVMKDTLISKCGFIRKINGNFAWCNDMIKVLPMGISKEAVTVPLKRPNSGKTRIGFFGFCYFHKGIDKLIQYMQLHGANKECLILSTKPENDSGYFDKAQQLMKNANSNITWVADYLSEDQISKALSTCDVIFLPYSEYGGLATSAAIRTCLKAGVPIVAFDTSFFRDVVHDEGLVEFIHNNPLEFDVWADKLNKFQCTY